LKSVMESSNYPTQRTFEWLSVTNFGEPWLYINGSVPESYSLDFSLQWPIRDNDKDLAFIKAWSESDAGAETAVYCLVDETGEFTIPTDIQTEFAALGLDAFDNIYVSRVSIETSVIKNVLIVKTAELTRGIFGSDLPAYLYTDQ